MKTRIATAASLACAGALALLPASCRDGGEAYTAHLSGLSCQACVAEVTGTLGELRGFRSVRFRDGEEPETRLATVRFDPGAAASQGKVSALLQGRHGEQYTLLSWEPGG